MDLNPKILKNYFKLAEKSQLLIKKKKNKFYIFYKSRLKRHFSDCKYIYKMVLLNI